MPDEPVPPLHSRRIVFHGLGAIGIAVALAGCGASGSSADTSGGPEQTFSSPKTGKVLAKTSEIPVDGGLILTAEKMVITQPTAGTFLAFSAVCTHQGYLVTSVANGLILCDHHGSEYNAQSGKVVQGPAPSALKAVAITVKADTVVAA